MDFEFHFYEMKLVSFSLQISSQNPSQWFHHFVTFQRYPASCCRYYYEHRPTLRQVRKAIWKVNPVYLADCYRENPRPNPPHSFETVSNQQHKLVAKGSTISTHELSFKKTSNGSALGQKLNGIVIFGDFEGPSLILTRGELALC